MSNPRVEAGAIHSHPRGIFEAEQTFPGLTTFRVFNCVGRLLELRAMEAELVDGQTRASLEWTLEHHCPTDPGRHAVTCASAREHRLRVMP